MRFEAYISSFSANARQVFEAFDFENWISKLDNHKLLYLITQDFKDFDLHPDRVSNHDMGLAFEHLIRRTVIVMGTTENSSGIFRRLHCQHGKNESDLSKLFPPIAHLWDKSRSC